jgi:hypothetical protein
MDQEKESTFKVTDKRSAFKEESSEAESNKKSDTASTPEESQKKADTENQPRQEQTSHAGDSPPLPEANFMTLIMSLFTHVQFSLGLIPDPMTQQTQKDLSQAKYNIDMLAVLQEKTKNNLTKEEEQALEQILYEVRMAYVQISKS